MKRLVLGLGVSIGLAVALTLSANADDQSVDTTVSPMVVAISVSPTSLDYGSLALNTNDNFPTPAFFSVSNVGTENVDLTIRGSDTGDWLLKDLPGTDEFVHWYGTSAGSITAKLTTSDKPLFTDLLANPGGVPGSIDIFLKLDMPTETTVYGTQTASVTIVASKH